MKATELFRRIVSTAHVYAVLFVQLDYLKRRRFTIVYKSDIEVVCRSPWSSDADRDFLTEDEVFQCVESLGASSEAKAKSVLAKLQEFVRLKPLDKYFDLCLLYSDEGFRRCPTRFLKYAERRTLFRA